MVIIYVPITISALYTNVTKRYIQEVWAPSVICFGLTGFVHPVLYLQLMGKQRSLIPNSPASVCHNICNCDILD